MKLSSTRSDEFIYRMASMLSTCFMKGCKDKATHVFNERKRYCWKHAPYGAKKIVK